MDAIVESGRKSVVWRMNRRDEIVLDFNAHRRHSSSCLCTSLLSSNA